MAHGRAVYTHLVRPPCPQIYFEEGYFGECFLDLKSGFCGATLTAFYGHLLSMLWMTPYRQVNDPGRFLYLAVNESQVCLPNFSLLELTAEVSVGKDGFCRYHCARGPLVKAVHDTRAGAVANSFDIGIVIEQGVHKGSAFMTCSRMHHEPRRLV
jgi:hypothetical protein